VFYLLIIAVVTRVKS